LTRDISDRITVTDTSTGINGDFFINGIDLKIDKDGFVEALYILAPAGPATPYFILGTSVLGTGILAPF
jgi:hypothetical protein